MERPEAEMPPRNQNWSQPDDDGDNSGSQASTKKVRFSPDQDSLIKHLAELSSKPNWSEIASHIPQKSAKQCRERYQHFLAPNIQREPWTPFEDAKLLHRHHFLGSDWAAIAQFFPGRTNNDVKNRFNGHLKGAEMSTFFSVMDSVLRENSRSAIPGIYSNGNVNGNN
jgi:hypothetical protein